MSCIFLFCSNVCLHSIFLPFHKAVETVDLHLDSYLSQKKDILNLLWLYILMTFMASMFGLQFAIIKASGELEQIFFGYNLYLPLPAALFVAYSCICASRLSIKSEIFNVVFRLKKDLPLHDGTGSLHLPTLAKCTCWSIVISFISINWYLMGVAVVLYGFNICLDHFAGPLPHAFVSVFYPILYFAGFLLYTLQIFDFHSNIMLVMCALQISLVGDDDTFWGKQLCLIPSYVFLFIELAKRAANVANISTGGVDSVPVARTESDLESIGMLLYDTTHLSSLLLNVTLALLNKSVYLSVCLSVSLRPYPQWNLTLRACLLSGLSVGLSVFLSVSLPLSS
jgi:hypothetical protein